MAAVTTSPASRSPQRLNTPVLPPLITSTNTNPPRRSTSHRQQTYANKRLSAFSPVSKHSTQSTSRPASHVFPAFHSSLSYALVRDFAYPLDEPLHYGPLPEDSGLNTPASESRRLSDPAGGQSWHDARGEAGEWPATPPWRTGNSVGASSDEQLPSMTFSDGGPPYSEDEDLHSPVVTASRHKKHKSSDERGRSPGAAGPSHGTLFGTNGDGSRQYYYADQMQYADENGPGGEIIHYPADQSRHMRNPHHRDSNFAAPIHRDRALTPDDHALDDDDDDGSEVEGANQDSRYSKEYSFTIASPDEEMHGKAVALFDFAREHENELPLKEGQIILVSYRHGQGWLVAEDPKTGESGLVPETFVRLVRDIEGGLNGLGAVNIHEGEGEAEGEEEDETEDDNDLEEDPDSATTPKPSDSKHSANASNGSNASEKHPPVQSSFSTSSKDLDPYPLPRGSGDAVSPARMGRLAEAR